MYIPKRNILSFVGSQLKSYKSLFLNNLLCMNNYSHVSLNLINVIERKSLLHLKTPDSQRYLHESSKWFAAHDKRLPFEVDTNIAKDVLLFEYKSSTFFKWITYFGTLQFIFWIYLAHFSYTHLIDISKSEEEKMLETRSSDNEKENNSIPWWRQINLGEKKYRNGISTLCTAIGYLVLTGTWMFSLRTVCQLVLLKGGKIVHITTYAPFGAVRSFTTPLNKMNCALSRDSIAAHLPIKVQGRWFYFLLDKRGKYFNTKLFDNTVGIKRIWKK